MIFASPLEGMCWRVFQEIALDINGAMLRDFADLPPEKLTKIQYINLTMHFMFIVVPLPSQALIGMEDDAPVLYSG